MGRGVPNEPGSRAAATGRRTSSAVARQRLRRLLEASGNDVLVGIDGGITRQNIGEVAKLGPDLMVTGSAVFDGKDPVGNAEYMLEAVVSLLNRRSSPRPTHLPRAASGGSSR